MNLSDWTVIWLYLAGIILFGIWIGRGQRSTKDYFLGSRNLSWWTVAFSIVATETSAVTFISVPAMAFGPENLALLQMVIGYAIARVVLAIVLVPHYFRGEIYSPYQLLGNAFGPSAEKMGGLLFLVNGILAAGVRVYVTCIPLRLLLGFNDSQMIWAILLFVVLSLAYTYFGGVRSVIWTDALQFFLFVAGGVFALFYIPALTQGGIGGAFAAAGAAGKLHWLNLHFSLHKPFNLWMGLIGGTFVTLSSHGADQLIVQRVLACPSTRDGRRALVLSALLIFPLFLMFLLVGSMLWVYYRQFPHLPIPLPEARPGVAQNDYMFPIFILTAMPHGMKGFLIVGVLAAAMSSVSSALTALASVSTMNFLSPGLRARLKPKTLLRASQLSVGLWAVGLVVVADLTRHVASVFNAAFSLSGLTSGALLGGVALSVFWKKGKALPVVGGMAISFLAMTLLFHYGGGALFWPWYTLTGTLISVGGAYLIRAIQGPLPWPLEKSAG